MNDGQMRIEQSPVPDEDKEIAEHERLARIVTRNHLAVFALALSVARIEVVADGKESLAAFSVETERHMKVPFLASERWHALTGSVMTGSNFELKSDLTMGTWYPDLPRTLPSEFDIPILGEDSFKTITSSRLRIERPSPNIPTVTTILGLRAIHTAKSLHGKPEFEITGDVAGPRAFEPLLSALGETSGGTTDYAELIDMLDASSRIYSPSEHRDIHYATPQDLEVPGYIMERSQNNFSVLSARIRILADSEPGSSPS